MATIQAAIERAKAQREAAQPQNTDALQAAQQKEIADIEARRQAALLTDGAVPTPASEKPE